MSVNPKTHRLWYRLVRGNVQVEAADKRPRHDLIGGHWLTLGAWWRLRLPAARTEWRCILWCDFGITGRHRDRQKGRQRHAA